MNKYTINIILILSIIILPSVIKAEDDVKPDRARMREEIKVERESFREDAKMKREELKDDRKELAEKRREDVSDIREGVRAQRASSTPEELKKLRENAKVEINKVRKDFQATIKTNRASTTEVIKEKRAELISNIQEKRNIFKDELVLAKEKKASTTAEARAKFKESLQKIKDEKKKIKLESVSDNIPALNTKLTDLANQNVNKIETILIAIESRADKATANGIDVSNVRSLINTAETNIAAARSAITAQVAKVYTIDITTEENAKSSAQKTRDLLKADIKIMNDKVKLSHESVKKAADALRIIPKINAPIATSTATTTN